MLTFWAADLRLLASADFSLQVSDLHNCSTSYNPQIEMFAHFKTKSSFHKTKGII